ncbi:MAG: hypothetical protein GY851_09645, partial [bacterium]|nr:hypothetical protein [bacterium]
FGYTSRSKHFKSRYNYSWDWCPRVVPVGAWDSLELRTGTESLFRVRHVETDLDPDNKTGRVRVTVEAEMIESARLTLTVRDAGHEIGRATAALGEALELGELPVEPWWPNGEGDAKTYELDVAARDESGETLWSVGRTIGFKRVEWRACEDAPADAEPWVCVVNGRPVFLQGANWVPPRACYADTTDEEYGRLISLYKEMGSNILRVWGGAVLEKEVFYDLCDQAGILVWQEFPLSSSGVENLPPSDEKATAQLTTIASSYIERRCHHVSLTVWCGGNELIDLESRPIGYDHPCIAALKALVEREDPSRRFLPTSPSGPRCWGGQDEWGTGVHHDVHGPWGLDGTGDMEGWRAYWSGDDALFRSEVGVPGASPAEMIEQYAGDLPAWPPTGEYWNHSASWWIQWDRVKGAMELRKGKVGLTEYVRLTQEIQAEGYAVAARACKRRFPACGGFIIWMGHDCFPCPANNSVIDFHRDPKPAFHALKDVFTRSPFDMGEEE